MESYLQPTERCIVTTRRHWLVPLIAMTRGGGMMVAVGALTFVAPSWFLVQLALWLAGVAHTGWVSLCVLHWRAEQITVTDRRIIRVSGLLTTVVEAVPVAEITDSVLRRSFLAHVFGYGTVRIETAGQDRSLRVMTYLPHSEALYRATVV